MPHMPVHLRHHHPGLLAPLTEQAQLDPVRDLAEHREIRRGMLRKMRQNLGWAIGYNVIALPIAAGVFEPAFGLVLRPEIAALTMSGSSLIVAVNALLLKRLALPRTTRARIDPGRDPGAGTLSGVTAPLVHDGNRQSTSGTLWLESWRG